MLIRFFPRPERGETKSRQGQKLGREQKTLDNFLDNFSGFDSFANIVDAEDGGALHQGDGVEDGGTVESMVRSGFQQFVNN
jgi:hypothetical protein